MVGSSQDSAEAIDPADTDTVYIAGGTNVADALMGASSPMLRTSWANGQTTSNASKVDSRWGTYEAISHMLPSAIDEAVHAQEADHATTADSATEADNADTLDGLDSGAFAPIQADGDIHSGRETSHRGLRQRRRGPDDRHRRDGRHAR